ncbi:MAG: SDR family oxidoreductase [Phycisphaeraceae bacterium]|nr:SDR family oxidoreductase [Phycisphaeraceae bacterium]
MTDAHQTLPRVLILGASGGVGRWVCRLATERSIHATALIRQGSAIETTPPVTIARGDALNPDFLRSILPGHSAVISCLGLRRARPWNPWSTITSPTDLTQRVTDTLARLMPEHGISRLVLISAAGVGDSLNRCNPVIRWLIRHSNLATAYTDLHAAESVLRTSTLDWTSVRPTSLTNGRPSGRVRIVDRYGLCSRITRGDLAAWLLNAAIAHTAEGRSADNTYDRTPMLAG